MKWLWCRPGWRVHLGTLMVCAVVLIVVGASISGQAGAPGSIVGRWLREKTIEPTAPSANQLRSSCFVIVVEGQIEMLGDGDLPALAVWREHQEQLYQYVSFGVRRGLLAITHTKIRHRLVKSPVLHSAYPLVSQALSERSLRTLSRGDALFLAANLSVAKRGWVDERRARYRGYLVNAAALLALTGLAWLIAWVPACIRAFIHSRRPDPNLCPVCQYDVCATPGRCPECGWGHEVAVDEG